MKYLDLTGLQHFFDNVKSRLLPTVKGENGTVLKSTETGYEWGKVIDDSNATSTSTTLSANGITQALDTLDQTVNGYIDDLEQTVNGKTSINDSATETTTTWSSSKINTELSSKADSDAVSELQTTVEGKADQIELDSLETTVENIRQVPTGGETGQFLRQDNTWADVPTGSWDQLLTNVQLSPSGWSKDYAVTPTQFPYGNRYDIDGITSHDMVIAYVDNSAGGMYTMSLCANVRVDNGFIVIGSNNNTITLNLKWIMIYKNKLPDNTNVYKAGFLVLGSDYQLARTLGAVHYIVTLPTTGWADNKITVSTDEKGAGIFLPAGTTYMPFSTDNYDFEISVPTLSSGTTENRDTLCKTGVYVNSITQKNLNMINVELGVINVPESECRLLLSININYSNLGGAY